MTTREEELKREIEKIEKEYSFVKNDKFIIYDVKKGLTIPSSLLLIFINYLKMKAELLGIQEGKQELWKDARKEGFEQGKKQAQEDEIKFLELFEERCANTWAIEVIKHRLQELKGKWKINL